MMSLEAQAGSALLTGRYTLATAESCTGGLIAHRLTNIAGSSAYVLGGVVAYHNGAKQALLHVREATLVAHGAVSAEVATEMAANARALFGSTFALSVTGIAGPGGGSAEKPVGLTYIGLASPDGAVIVERHVWDGDREANKAASADAALRLLLRVLEAQHG
jgi:PncC family amidohydrolase